MAALVVEEATLKLEYVIMFVMFSTHCRVLINAYLCPLIT